MKKIKHFGKWMFGFSLLFTLMHPVVMYGASGEHLDKQNEVSDANISILWKTLPSKNKKDWTNWAKNNCLFLYTEKSCKTSGKKAFEFIINNRLAAGDPTNILSTPAPANWLPEVLSTRDAGPFTENAGYVGFRLDKTLEHPTKWFVWATPPLLATNLKPLKRLRFIKSFSLGAMEFDDIIPSLGNQYELINGSFDGPGDEGAWPKLTFVWFRLQEYQDGQLGPAQIMKGRIQVEL